MSKIHQKSEEFDKESVYWLLIRYSLPATIGVAAFTLYNVIDRIFIGQAMGALALSGLTVTFPLFMICIAIGMLFGIGGGTLISLRMGERNFGEAENILGNTVSMFIISATIMGLLGLVFLKPILLFFGATETTMPYAAPYMKIILWFLPADFLAMGTNNSLRAEGNPRISMYILITGALLNILLDYIFIFPLKMGIVGAALATVISKMVSAAWVMLHFRVGEQRALTLRLRNLRLRWKLIRPMISIGLSPFIIKIVSSLVMVALNHQLLRYSGELAVGALGAMFSIMTLLNMPIWGLLHGSQPVIGFNYGAKNYQRVSQTLCACLIYAGTIGVAGLIICQAAPRFLIGLFGMDNPEFIEIGGNGMRLFFCMLPLANLNLIGIQFFQSTGRPKYSISLSLIKNLLILIPALYILPRLLNLNGVWLASPCCELGAALVIAGALSHECRRLRSYPKGNS